MLKTNLPSPNTILSTVQSSVKPCKFTNVTVLSSWDHRGRVIMIDHMRGRGRLAAPWSRLGTARDSVLRSFNLKPCIPECFGKVVVNWSCDGHRVCHWLRLLVILAKASAEVLFHHWVTGSGSWMGKERQKMHYFSAESRHQVLDSEPGSSPIFLSSQHKARLVTAL